MVSESPAGSVLLNIIIIILLHFMALRSKYK